jgi:hypothetical protein
MIVTSDKYDGDKESARTDLLDVLEVKIFELKITLEPMEKKIPIEIQLEDPEKIWHFDRRNLQSLTMISIQHPIAL